MKRLVVSVAAGLLLVACQDVPPPTSVDQAADVPGQPSFQVQYADHYIVRYSGTRMPDDAAELIRAGGGEVLQEWPEIKYAVVTGISNTDGVVDELTRLDMLDLVTRDIRIQWIPSSEANFDEATYGQLEAPKTETDQSGANFFAVGTQWNMSQIDADAAWLVTNQGAGTTVAVLDTGVDPGHQDLAGKIDGASTSVLTTGSSPCGSFDEDFVFDLNFHGSFVSGLVASNGVRMASVAPDASILAVKVLACDGFGFFSDVANGIIYAANNDADVINMSLGALLPTDTDDEALEQAIEDLIDLLEAAIDFATDRGVFVVAASGNDGLNFDDLPDDGACFPAFFGFGSGSCDDLDVIHVPSMLDNVLSVGATAPIGQANFDLLASYSNFGDHGADVMAPGGDFVGFVAGGAIEDLILSVCSTFVCGSPFAYVISAGTSFASPLAAGTAAVVIAEGEDADDCVEDGADEIESLSPEDRINVLGAAACEALETDDDDEDES